MALPDFSSQPGRIIPLERRRVMDGKVSGCVTGIAQDIETAMIRLNLPGRHQTFLHLLNKETFHVAGFHVQHGEAEHWCVFDLARWAHILGWQKSHVIRVRDRLATARILVWEPDSSEPGRGRLGWNLDLATWERTGAGGARPGAGRPSTNQTGYASLPEKNIQTGYENIQTGYGKVFKRDTPASYEPASTQGVTPPLRKVTKKSVRSSDANASGGGAIAPAPQASAPASEKKAKGNDIPQEYRGTLLGLVRATYPNFKANEGKELGAIRRLHEARAPADRVQECWEATLLDPRWEVETLSLQVIADRYGAFEKQPAGYRANMQRKRDDYTRRQEWQAKGGQRGRGAGPTNTPTGQGHTLAILETQTARRVAPGDDGEDDG